MMKKRLQQMVVKKKVSSVTSVVAKMLNALVCRVTSLATSYCKPVKLDVLYCWDKLAKLVNMTRVLNLPEAVMIWRNVMQKMSIVANAVRMSATLIIIVLAPPVVFLKNNTQDNCMTYRLAVSDGG
uniref:Uncharacterized protein n=1 Tax=Musca domestica TaxID=7370 RepID=A0A1I8MZ07_MUSDO